VPPASLPAVVDQPPADAPAGRPAGRPDPRRTPGLLDPAAVLQSFLPGLTWTQQAIEKAGRAQAAFAADALRRLNAPVVDALQRHREFAEALAASASQLGSMARQMEQLGRQHLELTRQMQAALEPFQRYVDWLGKAGKGGG
jgi:hypothetical protein